MFINSYMLFDAENQQNQADQGHNDRGGNVVGAPQGFGDIDFMGLDIIKPVRTADNGQPAQNGHDLAFQALHFCFFFIFICQGFIANGESVVYNISGYKNNNRQAGYRYPDVKIKICHDRPPACYSTFYFGKSLIFNNDFTYMDKIHYIQVKKTIQPIYYF